jgi:hypothetical protein
MWISNSKLHKIRKSFEYYLNLGCEEYNMIRPSSSDKLLFYNDTRTKFGYKLLSAHF